MEALLLLSLFVCSIFGLIYYKHAATEYSTIQYNKNKWDSVLEDLLTACLNQRLSNNLQNRY